MLSPLDAVLALEETKAGTLTSDPFGADGDSVPLGKATTATDLLERAHCRSSDVAMKRRPLRIHGAISRATLINLWRSDGVIR